MKRQPAYISQEEIVTCDDDFYAFGQKLEGLIENEMKKFINKKFINAIRVYICAPYSEEEWMEGFDKEEDKISPPIDIDICYGDTNFLTVELQGLLSDMLKTNTFCHNYETMAKSFDAMAAKIRKAKKEKPHVKQ